MDRTGSEAKLQIISRSLVSWKNLYLKPELNPSPKQRNLSAYIKHTVYTYTVYMHISMYTVYVYTHLYVCVCLSSIHVLILLLSLQSSSNTSSSPDIYSLSELQYIIYYIEKYHQVTFKHTQKQDWYFLGWIKFKQRNLQCLLHLRPKKAKKETRVSDRKQNIDWHWA